MRSGHILAGLILVLLGSFIIARDLGVSIPIADIAKYWPVLIMLIGISIIMKERWVAASVLAVFVVFAILFFAQSFERSFEPGLEREVVQKAQLGPDNAEVNIHYGAGNLKISDDPGYLFRNHILTSETVDPVLEVKTSGDSTVIDESKSNVPVTFGKSHADSWNITLSPDVAYDLNLDYGASEAKIDLSRLRITNLEINSGATDTEVKFAKYPTKASIETGASTFKLIFPKEAGVKINIEDGLVTKKFDGFAKKEDAYYSEGFDKSAIKINVDIKAGASEISTERI